MYYKKFTKDGVVYNTMVTYPECEFFVNNKKVYLNRETAITGDFSNNINHVSQGEISLAEININRPSGKLVKPFYIWDGIRQNMFGFDAQANTQTLLPGEQIDGAYPMSASISRIFHDHSAANNNLMYIDALRNPVELSGELSSKNSFANISGSDANIIAVPSVFYGSGVKKGTVKLDFYVTGALTATLQDTGKDGQLIETYGPNLGQVGGIALYDYGLFVLTGSTSLHATHTDNYYGSGGGTPSWLTFGTGMKEIYAYNYVKDSDGNYVLDADGNYTYASAAGSSQNVSSAPSYSVSFKGTNKVPTMTLLAHADRGELNYSTNPTFLDRDTPQTASLNYDSYNEKISLIKNIRKSKYTNFEEEFENTTYISQIGIYDEDKNLIAVAKLANPVKKTEIQDYMFKLRMDF